MLTCCFLRSACACSISKAARRRAMEAGICGTATKPAVAVGATGGAAADAAAAAAGTAVAASGSSHGVLCKAQSELSNTSKR